MQEKTRNAQLPQMQATDDAPVTVSVYDPAMCCSTGVCGPGVDPRLMEVSRDLAWLEAQGVGVERFNLAQEPQAFVENGRVSGLMQAFGEKALPAVVVNGEVHSHGGYPNRDELVEAVKSAKNAENIEASDKSNDSSCCGSDSGSGCC